MNNSFFGKTKENVRRHRDLKLVMLERKINYLVPESNYHTTQWNMKNIFLEKSLKKIGENIPRPFLRKSKLSVSLD